MNTTPTNHSPISIRPTAVAGSFYPKDASQLSNVLDEYLAIDTVEAKTPKAIIAPHAGYIYSGLTAAYAYLNIAQLKNKITRVVLLGPTHRVNVQGLALATNTHFSTPLGNISLDTVTLNKLEQNYSYIQFLDAAHEQEHSLEVHLPFLQKVLDDFILIPLLVGNAKPEQVESVLNELWGNDETLIVISSDLSHFLDYETACKTDSETTRLIENFEYKKIGSHQACGCMPLRGLLKLAQDKNMSIQTLDLRNSGDTAGTKDRVVGYGSYALFESRILNQTAKEFVFDVIHKSIEQGLKNKESETTSDTTKHKINKSPKILHENYAIFITLKLHGQLRGCIGTTEAHMPLIDAVAKYAYAAAFSDPRFKPLTEEEYKQVEISLSILTPAVPFPFDNELDLINKLRPDVDGLIISKGNARATFLPAVWESIKNPKQFIDELKRKAGITSSDAPDKAWRYSAEYYS